VTEGFSGFIFEFEIESTQEVVPSFAHDAAERTVELFGVELDEVVGSEDADGVEAGLHATVDAGELGETEAVESIWEFVGVNEDEAIGFLEFGGKFGEPGIGGDADAAGHAGGDVVADRLLELVGELGGSFGLAFFANEAESHFVDAADLVDRENRLDGFENGFVVAGVKGVVAASEDDVGAESFCFADFGSGFDSECFGLIGSGDDGAAIEVGGADGDGFAEEFGVFGLLYAGEV